MAKSTLQPGAAPAKTSRRALLGILATGPIAMLPPFAAYKIGTADAATGSDAALLAAWERRQDALAIIETRGAFFHSETHSPREYRIYEQAEDEIAKTKATTLRGAIVKLWVALDATGTCFAECDQKMHAAFRRADMAELLPLQADMDYDADIILSTISDLLALAGEA